MRIAKVLLGSLALLAWTAVAVHFWWARPSLKPRCVIPNTDGIHTASIYWERKWYLFDFSPDSRMVAAYRREEKTIRVWDVSTGEERLSIPIKEYNVHFSPDSRLLAERTGRSFVLTNLA